MQNLIRRISRRIIHRLTRHRQQTPWQLLGYYPHIIPTVELLRLWQHSEWSDYQQWINRHAILSSKQWLTAHRQAKKQKSFSRISIITPVYNVEPEVLKTCILSVRIQTTPYWELILVDDGSTNPGTLEVLQSAMCSDPRIHILHPAVQESSGISAATNRGLARATGEYILFLDHDDRLAPEAVQAISAQLTREPELDIVYSDRDMISPDNKRYMHLMKPDWSPETLYSGNYIFHLLCYRKKLLDKVGGLRTAYDGSQDYDLILRCMEYHPRVHHIPQILYHWRQHEQSVAMADTAKSYAFDAGIRALQDALARRGIQAKVTEDQTLPRGIYHVHLPPIQQEDMDIVTLPPETSHENYRKSLLNAPQLIHGEKPYIVIKHQHFKEDNNQTLGILTSWLAVESIGMVSGCLLDASGTIVYAGMTYDEKGKQLVPYSGFPASEPGYMAVTKIVRNISGPNPFCVGIRRELWEQLDGFKPGYDGPYALLDFALRALQNDWRILYNPQAIFTCSGNVFKNSISTNQDVSLFTSQWKQWLLRGDPYYSPNLSRVSHHCELVETI